MATHFHYLNAVERALLVTVDLHEKNQWRIDDIAKELVDLTRSTGVEVVEELSLKRHAPSPALYLGKGKAEEIAEICRGQDIDTVIFNNDLSGTQQRNLEEALKVKTIDRTQLILDIFARHARSPEGKMQVELAQLVYLLPRLSGKGVMLSRLGGGIGTRGPGEQKLEMDRRRIREKIDKLRQDIAVVRSHRKTVRKKRQEMNMPTVALVGYTNAGKSTLLNALVDAGQEVRDSLFTTLDILSKRLVLPSRQVVVLSDTVGFLYKLPHHLIEAFKATLEEVVEADLLLHVLDVSNPNFYKLNEAVYTVLRELESDTRPVITVLNKIDKLADREWLVRIKMDFPNSVAVSALQEENLQELIDMITRQFSQLVSELDIDLPFDRMDLVNLIHQEGKVLDIKYSPKTIHIHALVSPVTADKIKSYRQHHKSN
jgi:GTPase